MTERHTIPLPGCTPSPLAGYLKGLGLLRVLSQADPDLRAAWSGECLELSSRLDEIALREHLLHHYAPTPVLAPWNGGSGFYEKDSKDAIEAIRAGAAERLASYRAVLAAAEAALAGHDRSTSPKGADKHQLLLALRASLPDAALDWFDAAVLLSADEPRYPPLLGTGGNDGRLDFTNNFMQRLVDLFDPATGRPSREADVWLTLALKGQPAPGLAKNAIGQFSPGQVGGPSATTGYETKGAINPWDFVLMIEGALPFAAAAVRRNASDESGVLAYPFTVRATAAGSGGLGVGDAAATRGELWMPLWSRPASYAEVRSLLAEGRVALGSRPARDALDFVRAVHRLGGYRGVDRFQRYGLLMRSGKAYLATPIERIQVTGDPHTDFIDELERDDWLERFRRFAAGDATARRFATLRQRLENQLFELAQRRPNPARIQALLTLLGEIQQALAESGKAREALRPVPQLSARWVAEADDQGPAFRIARALAGLRGVGGVGGQPLPLRCQLFPLHPRWNGWIDNSPGVRLQVPRGADLVATLIAVLERRLWLTGRLGLDDKPLTGATGIDLDDLDAFLRGPGLDTAIAELLPGLALCEIPPAAERGAGEGNAPAAFGLLRLALTPDATLRALGRLRPDQRQPVPPGLVARLASGHPGQAERAVELACQRLHASGLNPALPRAALPRWAGLDPRRAAAALLIPLNFGASAALAHRLLAADESAQAPNA